eukprot:UN16532
MIDPSLLFFNAVMIGGFYQFNKVHPNTLVNFKNNCIDRFGPNGEQLALGGGVLGICLLIPGISTFVIPIALFIANR